MFPRVGIPEPNSVVPTAATCEYVSIGTERYTSDRVRPPTEGAEEVSGVSVPQMDRRTLTPTCEGSAIGRKHDAPNTFLISTGQIEQIEFFTRLRVIHPDTDSTCNRQMPAIRRIRNFIYPSFTKTRFRIFW